MHFTDLGMQYRRLKPAIDRRIRAVLDHGRYILGPEVEELEEQLADYIGVRHAITCANGTDALQLSLMALGVRPGDAVFVPAFTFFATAEAVALVGATPIFVDVQERSFNLCSRSLERQVLRVLESGEYVPRAVIAVDLFGLPADYAAITAVASRFGLLVVEDGAQGFGASIDGRRVGTFGSVATTSFFPAKPLGCYGDGGATFTNDDDLAVALRSLRQHGKGVDKYDNVRIGMNSRLDTIQAAVLLEKFSLVDPERARRDALARRYLVELPSSVVPPLAPEGKVHAWAQFTIATNDRDALQKSLQARGIPSMVYYRKCLHQQPVFSGNGNHAVELPTAERLARRVLSLPVHAGLDDEDVSRVAALIDGG